MTAPRFRRLSAAVLVSVLAVIVWGAFVRASGSGAGCGAHWPLCNGEVLPRPKSIKTVIELTHRLTSGLCLLFIVAQLPLAFRAFPRGHLVRRAAVWSTIFIFTEALVGGGLVLFEMVAENASIARGAWMIAHLGNTFALVAACAVTWWAAGPSASRAPAVRGGSPGWLLAGLAGLLLVGMSGAIAALGDTLFPARSLAEGLRQDLSGTAHLFLRLRFLHPMLAIGTGLYLLAVAGSLAARHPDGELRSRATALAGLVLAQIAAGFLNLALLAPTWMQLVHLLLADLVWIVAVLLTAAQLRGRSAAAIAVPGGARAA